LSTEIKKVKLSRDDRAVITKAKKLLKKFPDLIPELATAAAASGKRVEVVHPTPTDPVLLLDGKAAAMWV
jgi:hypothetical protein